ncbi:unnamed protein product [Linum tenue]|uniref:Uncharacterized protein n=1 Tax=Linum tenue TaxID=586396 RepID=A0AAV0Q5Z7_9ROSI|nr:unnamed protein product [Linum tenue]
MIIEATMAFLMNQVRQYILLPHLLPPFRFHDESSFICM